MLDLLKQFKSGVHVGRRSQDHVSVDSVVSVLHHRATTVILLVSCVLVSSRQYFGDPILCIQSASGDNAAIPSSVLNTYCFVTSTYTVVGPEGETWKGHGEEQRRHAYYQWVPFVLFLQALLFAVPNALWRDWEGGLVRASVVGLKTNNIKGPDKDRVRTLARYFAARLHTFRFWAAGFYACEFLNLLNVVANILLTDILLGSNFYQYGLRMELFDIQTSPGSEAFPKVTKCTFRKYGPSGTIQTHDALCVMALNVVNEKIFTALWFWFALLTLVTTLALLWRVMTLSLLACASAHSRSFIAGWAQRALGLPVKMEPSYLSPVTRRLDCGDWLFLQLLVANMSSGLYKEFMEQLVQAMERGKPSELQSMWIN